MRNLIFVITIMPLLAFGKNLNWSKKWIRHYNNKSWVDICKKPEKRAEPVCKSLKKAMLQDKSKFKWKLDSGDTAEVTFKKYSVKVRRSDDPSVYLVNRRSLYLEEIKNLKQMNKEVQKLLPKAQASRNLWISTANADDFPTSEIGAMITLMIIQNKEQEICETAQKLVKACKPFDDKFIESLKTARKEDPTTLPALINRQNYLRSAELMVSYADHFATLFSSVDESKVTALNKCECKEGLCQIKEKKTDLSEAYVECKQNIKAIRDLKKSKDLKHLSPELLSEEMNRLAETIATLEKTAPTASSGRFKEESYKAHK